MKFPPLFIYFMYYVERILIKYLKRQFLLFRYLLNISWNTMYMR
jgi:hypothetical protein